MISNVARAAVARAAPGRGPRAAHSIPVRRRAIEDPDRNLRYHSGMLIEDADAAGRAYAAETPRAHQKAFGQYLTPPPIAGYMARRAELPLQSQSTVRILDPAAGSGTLAIAACEALANLAAPPKTVQLVAYELDRELAQVLRSVLRKAKRRLAPRIQLNWTVVEKDFVLQNASVLTEDLFEEERGGFDLVIANPPYFKVAKSDPRAVACAALVHGQPNIYAFFMGISARLLRPGGQFCFITPRSWASGPYFEHFRREFFRIIRPTAIHLFDSRTASFSRDEVLQEIMITWGIRDDNWLARGSPERIEMTTSEGAHDLEDAKRRTLHLDDLLDPRDKHVILKLPASEADDEVVELVHSWKGSLAAHGLKISTGPVVHFRALEHLLPEAAPSAVPLLWLSHVRAMQVRWPLGLAKKCEYIRESKESAYILVPNMNYVLLRRFSAKEEARRLVAAPYFAIEGFNTVGLENHLNYIYRPSGTLSEDEAWGLSALLNSATLDRYFRCVNGNTQVSATELRAMPLPELKVIKNIGRRVRGCTGLEKVDLIVGEFLGEVPRAAVA